MQFTVSRNFLSNILAMGSVETFLFVIGKRSTSLCESIRLFLVFGFPPGLLFSLESELEPRPVVARRRLNAVAQALLDPAGVPSRPEPRILIPDRRGIGPDAVGSSSPRPRPAIFDCLAARTCRLLCGTTFGTSPLVQSSSRPRDAPEAGNFERESRDSIETPRASTFWRKSSYLSHRHTDSPTLVGFVGSFTSIRTFQTRVWIPSAFGFRCAALCKINEMERLDCWRDANLKRSRFVFSIFNF